MKADFCKTWLLTQGASLAAQLGSTIVKIWRIPLAAVSSASHKNTSQHRTLRPIHTPTMVEAIPTCTEVMGLGVLVHLMVHLHKRLPLVALLGLHQSLPPKLSLMLRHNNRLREIPALALRGHRQTGEILTLANRNLSQMAAIPRAVTRNLPQMAAIPTTALHSLPQMEVFGAHRLARAIGV